MTEKIPSFISDYESKYSDLKTQNTSLEQQIQTVTVEFQQSRESETKLAAEQKRLAREVDDKILKHNEVAQENTAKLTQLMSELQLLKSQCNKLQHHIDIQQSLSSFHDSCGYSDKIRNLQLQIDTTKLRSKTMEDSITS